MALNPIGRIRVNVTGARGLSDYQLWLSNGNEGNYQDYLDYLAAVVIANNPGFQGPPGSTPAYEGANVLESSQYDPTASAAQTPTGVNVLAIVKKAIANFSIPLSFSQGTAYPVGTVGAKLLQIRNPIDAPYNAKGDGASDDRGALFLADAFGSIQITANHRISSNVTFNGIVTFNGTGRLTIDAGVTVTFAQQPNAPWRQIFYGAGIVAGLKESRLEWFVGDADAAAPTVECGAGVRAWLNSVVKDGTLRAMPMRLLVDGTNPYDVSKGQSFYGPGQWQLFFCWTGTVCNGFRWPAGNPDGAPFSGFQWRVSVPGTIPTAGIALDIGYSYVTLSDFFINDCYIGARLGSVVATFMNDFQIIGAVNSGIQTTDGTLDYHINSFVIQALNDWVTLSGVTGTINVGDAITVSTGQTGVINDKYDATHYRVRFVGPMPATGATLSTSNGSGVISSITVGHQQAGLALFDTGEAITIRAGDVLGGMYGLVGFTSGGLPRDGFTYSRIESVYFDSAYKGSSLTNAYGNVFVSVWFASAANNGAKGLNLAGCRRVTFTAPQFVNNADSGLGIAASCSDISVTDIMCDGNNTLGGVGEVFIEGGAKNIRFTAGKAGYQGANGITPPKSFVWGAGDSQSACMNCVDVPSGSVTDLSTAAEKTFVGIRGIDFRNI